MIAYWIGLNSVLLPLLIILHPPPPHLLPPWYWLSVLCQTYYHMSISTLYNCNNAYGIDSGNHTNNMHPSLHNRCFMSQARRTRHFVQSAKQMRHPWASWLLLSNLLITFCRLVIDTKGLRWWWMLESAWVVFLLLGKTWCRWVVWSVKLWLTSPLY